MKYLPENTEFEEFSKSNGMVYWFASDLAKMLGYEDLKSLRKAINKAQVTCATLNIPIEENFISKTNDKGEKDLSLTRFACYLVTMNADPKRPNVAKWQVYFATMAESMRQYLEQVENVDRVKLRSELTDRNKSLQSIAKNAGVQQYGWFINAGYRGMYNMNIGQLRKLKGITDNKISPLDFMGKTELAANLFRVTQTEEKIKNENIYGQRQSEEVAEVVGKEVRATMHKISGVNPEELPYASDIKKVKSEIKKTARQFKKSDKKKIINNKKSNE